MISDIIIIALLVSYGVYAVGRDAAREKQRRELMEHMTHLATAARDAADAIQGMRVIFDEFGTQVRFALEDIATNIRNSHGR